ncbi:helix-turn-helix domain-containing protein [Nocardia cyriacigeorgica]|nr:helix-turn-helix domain-containing protein [Nocardia cyriacigeorgica]
MASMPEHRPTVQTLQAASPDDWPRVCGEAFVPVNMAVDETFRGSIRQIGFAGIGISRVDTMPVVLRRSASLIAKDPREDLFLVMHLSGRGWVDQTSRTARLAANTAAVIATHRPYRLSFDTPVRELVLQVPRARLRLGEAALRETTGRLIEGGPPGLTLLAHVMIGVLAEGCPPGTTDQLAETVTELLAAVLRPDACGAAHRPLSGEALLHTARAYMRRHLTDPGLDVAAVAAAHSISRRYLEQLFARAGDSPAAYLRRLRLAEAKRLLRDTPETIANIAHLAGFNDVNTFTRAFRRAHEVTPREWRRELLEPHDRQRNRGRGAVPDNVSPDCQPTSGRGG